MLSAFSCLNCLVHGIAGVAVAEQRMLDGVDTNLMALVLAYGVDYLAPIDGIGHFAAGLNGKFTVDLTLSFEASHEPVRRLELPRSAWKAEMLTVTSHWHKTDVGSPGQSTRMSSLISEKNRGAALPWWTKSIV